VPASGEMPDEMGIEEEAETEFVIPDELPMKAPVPAETPENIAPVTTSDDDAPYPPYYPGGQHGELQGDTTNPKVLTPTTVDVSNKFKQKVNVGTNGGTEAPLVCATKALTPPLITSTNAGFLRYDANLAVVVVSDAADQSPDPVSYYYNRMMNVKGFNRASMFTFNVIGPFASVAPSGCTYDDTSPDDGRYAYLVGQTSGVKEEICSSNWSQKLQDLGKTAFGFRTVFYLNSTPDLTGGKTLEVKIDGVVVPAVSAGKTQWSYDPVANAVKFDATTTPGAGKTLTVTYFTACL
jgi:hypothetical protein